MASEKSLIYLQKIYQQNDPVVEKDMETNVKEEIKTMPLIPLYAERTIQEYYSEKGMEIGKIRPTRNRDVFAVEVNGETEYIELGDFYASHSFRRGSRKIP